jgi:hypothetical protein
MKGLVKGLRRVVKLLYDKAGMMRALKGMVFMYRFTVMPVGGRMVLVADGHKAGAATKQITTNTPPKARS